MNESSQDDLIEKIFQNQKLKKIPDKMLKDFELEVYQRIWAPAPPFPWMKLGLGMIFILGCALMISQLHLADQKKSSSSNTAQVSGKTVLRPDVIQEQSFKKSQPLAIISVPEIENHQPGTSASLQSSVPSVTASVASDQKIFSQVSQDLWVLEMLDEDQDFLQDQDLIKPEIQVLNQIQ